MSYIEYISYIASVELDRLGRGEEDYKAQISALEDFESMSEKLKDRLSGLSYEQKRELICNLVDMVTVGEEVRVTLALGAPVMEDSKARL